MLSTFMVMHQVIQQQQKNIYHELEKLINPNELFVIGGDFNVICRSSDSSTGNTNSNSSIHLKFMKMNELHDVSFSLNNNEHTFTRGTYSSRLDFFVTNKIGSIHDFKVIYDHSMKSDHKPISILIDLTHHSINQLDFGLPFQSKTLL